MGFTEAAPIVLAVVVGLVSTSGWVYEIASDESATAQENRLDDVQRLAVVETKVDAVIATVNRIEHHLLKDE